MRLCARDAGGSTQQHSSAHLTHVHVWPMCLEVASSLARTSESAKSLAPQTCVTPGCEAIQEHDAGVSGEAQPSFHPAVFEALTELATRLGQQGVSAKVYVHDGMMTAMTHRDGDTEATVDDALGEVKELVEERTAQIATERGLPEDWLSRLCSTAQVRSCTTRAECRSCPISPVPLKPFPL